MSGRDCAVCDQVGYAFYIHEIHLSQHINGIGNVVFPAKIKSKAVTIKVCLACNEKINGILVGAVKEYHLDEVVK